jgi:hypothetical protein
MSVPKPLTESDLAKQALISNTRAVIKSMPGLSAWVLGGFGIGLGLFLAHIDVVSKFIYVTHVRFALVVFLFSVAAAVMANFLSTVIRSSLAVTDDLDAYVKEHQPSGLNLELFLTEYRRGLFPHVAWMTDKAMQKARAGDKLFGARLVAKMSQIQGLLVFGQCVLALVALGGLALGIKMQ